jgi:restriction system protein
LVDGDGLCDLLKQLKIGVTVRLVEEIAVDAQHFKGV